MNKYTVYYKRLSNSPFVGGKNANDEVQHSVVEAGNVAGAITKVKEQQKMFMNRDIAVVSIIREIEPDQTA